MFQTENPFSVLGIPITASSEEVAAAWKVKVKQLHPDRYPNAPEEILEKLTGQVSRVNAAYEVLKRDLEGTRRIFAEPN
jgi:curved DNA-binding protein CbpA